MEIERKFLINKIPFHLEMIDCFHTTQNYICLDPEIRIRKKVNMKNKETKYYLTRKTDGTLTRDEKEIEISKKDYDKYSGLTLSYGVKKEQFNFKLDDTHILECSIVDYGRNYSFSYAEIEFNTEEEALNYNLPEFLITNAKEVTDDTKYKMKNYYRNTRKIK